MLAFAFSDSLAFNFSGDFCATKMNTPLEIIYADMITKQLTSVKQQDEASLKTGKFPSLGDRKIPQL